MKTQVVNIKHGEKYDVYIGRGSIFGNPYEIGKDGTREQVIKRYQYWFNFLLKDEVFKKELLKLKNKRLGCFCKDKTNEILCHGDVIIDYLLKIND